MNDIDMLHTNYRRALKAYGEKDQLRASMARKLRRIADLIDPPRRGSSAAGQPVIDLLSQKNRASLDTSIQPSVTIMLDERENALKELIRAWNAIPDGDRASYAPLPRSVPSNMSS